MKFFRCAVTLLPLASRGRPVHRTRLQASPVPVHRTRPRNSLSSSRQGPLCPAVALVLQLLCPILPAGAQGCYADPIYGVALERDVVYGTAVDYCGSEVQLLMDVYRPVGDGNARRPAIVLAHGGAFLSGDKGSYDMAEAAAAFAARGYLAASINYRLGFHKSVFHTPDAQGCAFVGALAGAQEAQCLYAYPAEVERALYRAVQDARGAIRFVKTQVDSVDAGNVFIGGGSAGGFVAMAAAYMEDAEAPAAALAQGAVSAIPFIYGACHPPGCSTARPALGLPQGDLHLGQADASVKGVLNIYGALLDPSWIDAGEPMLYAYHKDNDLVVPCGNGRPFRDLIGRCLNNGACTAVPNTWPEAFGSCRLQDYLDTLSGAPAHAFQIESCPPPAFPCSYSCHEVTAEEVRRIVQGAAEFWGCTITNQRERESNSSAVVFPNPATGEVTLRGGAFAELQVVELYSPDGRLLRRFAVRGELRLNLEGFPPGVYLLRWNGTVQRIVIRR